MGDWKKEKIKSKRRKVVKKKGKKQKKRKKRSRKKEKREGRIGRRKGGREDTNIGLHLIGVFTSIMSVCMQ